MKLSGISLLNQQQIEQLIQHHLKYVFFPQIVEHSYRLQYQRAAAYEMRVRAPIILAFYLFLNFGMYQLSEHLQLSLDWLYYSLAVGCVIILVWLCSFISRLETYFDYYTGVGAASVIGLSFLMTALFQHVETTPLLHIALIYAVIIVYAFLGLRFYPAIYATSAGGGIAIIICIFNQYPLQWNLFHYSYFLSSCLGMALAYVIDYQHRFNFLQSCLIKSSHAKLAQQTSQLEHVSRQDALTGLANRRYLTHFLDIQWPIAIENKTQLSIMMLDIDYFKRYNDTLGHVQGDECLKKVAQLLQATTLRRDELAIRYGGEEFLLIFPYLDDTQTEKLAQYLLRRVRDLKIIHPSSLVHPHVTISLGFVNFTPQPGDQASSFIHLADQALYQAKHAGRNCYVKYQMDEQSDQ